MNASPRRDLGAAARLLAALACGGLCLAAAAAPRSVEAFEPATWAALQAGLTQPTAVVFSTTDCAHCPAAIDKVTQALRDRKAKASTIVVVMDVAPGDDDDGLVRHPHHAQVDRVFAFSGQSAALRHGVEPRWRGVTPYVMLLRPRSPARAVTGPPSAADIDAWLKPAGR